MIGRDAARPGEYAGKAAFLLNFASIVKAVAKKS
jgi:hypothetical protein